MTCGERYLVTAACGRAGEQQVCAFLSRRLRELGVSRTALADRATTRVIVALDDSLPADDTFRIAANGGGRPAGIRLAAATLPGLYAAAGTWLRSRMVPLNMRSTPALHGRALFLAIHFDVCYTRWSREQWRRYLEECASWGMNLVWTGYDLRDYHPPWTRGWRKTYPNEARRWDLVSNVYRTARGLGMKTALILCPNMGFRGQADDEIRAKPMPRFTGDVARTELCPSTSRGRKVLLESHRRIFSTIPPFDYILYWPLDAGGCGCDRCTPWVGKAFLDLCRDSARVVRKIHKDVRIFVSDTYAEPADHALLLKALRGGDMHWLDGIVDAWDRWTEPFPCYSPEQARRQLASMARRVPKGHELGICPDLSMTFARRPNGRNTIDWGFTGANPFPERFSSIMRKARRATVMMAYTEGIFDDFNKAAVLGSAWDPERTARIACSEYAAAYFPSVCPKTFTDLLMLLEANQTHWPSTGDVAKMLSLRRALDEQMTDRERRSWRWRILVERVTLEEAVGVALSGKRGSRKLAEKTIAGAVGRLRRIYGEPGTRTPTMNAETVIGSLLTFEQAQTRADTVEGVDPEAGRRPDGADCSCKGMTTHEFT